MFAANSLSSGRTFRREEEERVRRKRRGRVLWRQIRIRPSQPSFRRAGAIDVVRQKGTCQLGSRYLGVVLIHNRKFRMNEHRKLDPIRSTVRCEMTKLLTGPGPPQRSPLHHLSSCSLLSPDHLSPGCTIPSPRPGHISLVISKLPPAPQTCLSESQTALCALFTVYGTFRRYLHRNTFS